MFDPKILYTRLNRRPIRAKYRLISNAVTCFNFSAKERFCKLLLKLLAHESTKPKKSC